MKAAVMAQTGGPSVLQLQEVEDPEPTPTQVVIKVAACGMCGHDQADRLGMTKIPMPNVLGHEVAGVVAEVGNRVRGFDVGDRVAIKQFTNCGHCLACRSGLDLQCPDKSFNYGGYAEYMAVEDTAVMRVPDNVSLAAASVVACTVGTCYQAITRIGRLVAGETVVVTGAGGGLGLHGMQVVRALGGIPIALTGSPEKADKLLSSGAEHVVISGAQAWQEILDLTGGRGAEMVLDNVGHPSIFSTGFRALAHSGRYVFTGQMTGDKVGIYPAFVFAKEAVITGSASTLMSSFIKSMELVSAGKVVPVIEEYDLLDVVEAFTAVDDRKVTGRAVLTPDAGLS